MSGGGNRPLKGRMSCKLHSDVSPEQLAMMEGKVQNDEKALQDCAQRRDLLEEQVKKLKCEIMAMEKIVKQLARDLDVLEVQAAALAQRMEELQKQAQEVVVDQTHMSGLEKTVGVCEKYYQKATWEASEIQDQVTGLHEAIMDIGGSRMQSQQAHVDAIKSAMDTSNSAIAKANVGMKSASRNTAKSRKKITSLEEEVAELERKGEELSELAEAVVDEAKEVFKLQEELRESVPVCEKELLQLKGELEGLEKEEGEMQAAMVDLRHSRDKHLTKLKECEQKIKYYTNEMKKLNVGGEKKEMSEEQLLSLDRRQIECEIATLGEMMEKMTPNMAAIEGYKRKEEQHKERLAELDRVIGQRDEARSRFDELRKERLDRFMVGFSVITNKLKEMYQMITLGGDAELELVDSLDPFSEGIIFSVRPPKKSWKNISNLSGGEKTLSSLALVFALHHYKPSPLYVMDEIDAALDFKNVSIVAHYIKERTRNAQFIIISLRNNMFELADRLVGIYKTHNATKSVTIDPYKIIISA